MKFFSLLKIFALSSGVTSVVFFTASFFLLNFQDKVCFGENVFIVRNVEMITGIIFAVVLLLLLIVEVRKLLNVRMPDISENEKS